MSRCWASIKWLKMCNMIDRYSFSFDCLHTSQSLLCYNRDHSHIIKIYYKLSSLSAYLNCVACMHENWLRNSINKNYWLIALILYMRTEKPFHWLFQVAHAKQRSINNPEGGKQNMFNASKKQITFQGTEWKMVDLSVRIASLEIFPCL